MGNPFASLTSLTIELHARRQDIFFNICIVFSEETMSESHPRDIYYPNNGSFLSFYIQISFNFD